MGCGGLLGKGCCGWVAPAPPGYARYIPCMASAPPGPLGFWIRLQTRLPGLLAFPVPGREATPTEVGKAVALCFERMEALAGPEVGPRAIRLIPEGAEALLRLPEGEETALLPLLRLFKARTTRFLREGGISVPSPLWKPQAEWELLSPEAFRTRLVAMRRAFLIQSSRPSGISQPRSL